MIDQPRWHLRYDILKNKSFDVKKLIPKIPEEFTIVIIKPLQMPSLKKFRYAPAKYCFVFCFMFCCETDNLRIRTFKVTHKKSPETLSGDMRPHCLPSTYDTKFFSSFKKKL